MVEVTFEQLLYICEKARVEWHKLSQEYQSMPYGDERRIAKIKADIAHAEFQRLKNEIKNFKGEN